MAIRARQRGYAASTPVRVRVRRPPRNDGESRWPAAVATVAAIVLYAALPGDLLFGPRWVIPGLELAILDAVVVVNPVRMTRRSRPSRITALILTFLIMATNLVSLILLLHAPVGSSTGQGAPLLLTALQVWLTNVIVFGLAFWELDRGGPTSDRAHWTPRPSTQTRPSTSKDQHSTRRIADQPGPRIQAKWSGP